MEKKKTRISVDLSDACIKVLRGFAEADGRLLKNYVEKILIDLSEVNKKKSRNGAGRA